MMYNEQLMARAFVGPAETANRIYVTVGKAPTFHRMTDGIIYSENGRIRTRPG